MDAQVLCHFGSTDGRALGFCLLRDAADRRDGMDVEMALIVCATFGFTMDHLDLLVQLVSGDWHRKHGRGLVSRGVVGMRAARWRSRRSGRWAARRGRGAEAEQVLERLLGAEGEVVREAARAQLARREER